MCIRDRPIEADDDNAVVLMGTPGNTEASRCAIPATAFDGKADGDRT